MAGGGGEGRVVMVRFRCGGRAPPGVSLFVLEQRCCGKLWCVLRYVRLMV